MIPMLGIFLRAKVIAFLLEAEHSKGYVLISAQFGGKIDTPQAIMLKFIKINEIKKFCTKEGPLLLAKRLELKKIVAEQKS